MTRSSMVLQERHDEALQRHAPDLVLCCWQPLGMDLTAAMRATPSVREYVLVGEADSGMCGHHQLTWGGTSLRSAQHSPPGQSPLTLVEGLLDQACMQSCSLHMGCMLGRLVLQT